MDNWTVYIILISPKTGYIGITTRPLRVRHREHLQKHELKGSTIKPIETLVGTRKEAEQREKYNVWKYTKMGYDLLNKKHIPFDREAFTKSLSQVSFV